MPQQGMQEHRQRGGGIESPRATACPEGQNTAEVTKSELRDQKQHIEIRGRFKFVRSNQERPKSSRSLESQDFAFASETSAAFLDDKSADQRNTLGRSKASRASSAILPLQSKVAPIQEPKCAQSEEWRNSSTKPRKRANLRLQSSYHLRNIVNGSSTTKRAVTNYVGRERRFPGIHEAISGSNSHTVSRARS
jgi:hypothetical protein